MNVSLKKITDVLNRLQAQITALSGGGSSGVQSVVAGTNVTVDDTDPQNPVVNATGGGGSSSSPARAWRIWMSKSNGNAALEVRKLRMAATSGGADLCTGGTAFADTQYSTAYQPSNAFGVDGGGTDSGNAWSSAGGGSIPGYLGYIFPAAKTINEIKIEAPHNENTNQCPRDIIVQSSAVSTDGANGIWVNEWAIVDQTGWTNSEVRTFTRPA